MLLKSLSCLLMLRLLIHGTQGQGRGGGYTPQDRGPGRGQPRGNACDSARLGGVPDATKTVLEAALTNPSSVPELLPLIGDLPPVCLRLLRGKFEEAAGTCTAANVAEMLCSNCGPSARSPCESRRAFELLYTSIACLNTDLICDFLTVMFTNKLDCLPVAVTGALAQMSLGNQCSVQGSMPVCTLLSMSKDKLETYLEGIDASALLSLLVETDVEFTEALSCQKLQVLASAVQSKDLFDFERDPLEVRGDMDQYVQLLPLMPYLPKNVCADITVPVLKELLPELSAIDFLCGSNSEQARESNPGRGRGSGGPNRESSTDDDSSSGMCGLGNKDAGHMREVIQQRGRNRRCQFHCGVAIVESLTADGCDISNATVRAQLDNLKRCLPPGLLKNAVKPGQCADFRADQVPAGGKGGRAIASNCRPDKSADTWTTEDIQSMGCTFTALGRFDLNRIPMDQLCAALGGTENDLSDCMKKQVNRPQDFDRVVVKKCSGPELSADKVRKLGRGAVKAPCSAWANMSASDREAVADEMAEGLEEMVNNKQRGTKSKASCIKLSELPMKKLAESRAMADNVPLKDFKTKVGGNKAAFRHAMGLDEGTVPDLPRRQNRMGFALMRGATPCENMTRDEIMEMSSVVRGIPTSCVRKLNHEERLDILQHLCSFGDWDQKQSVAIGDALNEALADFDPENPMAEITTELVEDLDTNCLIGLGKRLANMFDEACTSVCERLGVASGLQCVMNANMKTRIATICVQCMGAADRALTEEEVMTLGQLLPHVAPEVLEKVTGENLKKNGKMFSNLRCIKKDVIDVIQGKINGAISDNDTADSLGMLGAWAAGLPSDKMDLVKVILSDLVSTITEDLAPSDYDHCCKRDMSQGELEQIKTDIDTRLTVIGQLVQDTAETETTTRRKRATNPVTCTSMQAMGSAVITLTVDEIAALTELEFIDCMQTLGDQDGWSQAQIDELMEKVKELVAANVCTMSSDNLQTLGSIAYGLTVAEVQCLDGLDLDAMSNLGDLDNWPQEHKTAFATRYLEKHNRSSPSSLTSEEVIAMGNFLCGLTPAEIGQLSTAVYGEASAAVGTVMACPHAQLVALAAHAKHADNLGPVSDWTATEFGEAGVVIAGLTADELKSVSVDNLEGWAWEAVGSMRIEDLAQLSVEQLGSLSVDQAYAIDTSDQAFSDDQRTALSRARASFDGSDADGEDGGDGTNGVTHVEASIGALLVLMVCRLL